MRRVSLAALLALAACSEPVPDLAPPLDRFYYPSSLALAPTTSGAPSLLVVSSNFDLQYGPERGGSLLAVDPDASLGAAGGALTVAGTGAVLGSYAGQLAVVDQASCPGVGTTHALVASRYTRKLHEVPLDATGGTGACGAGACERALDPDAYDPYAITVTCRSDGARRSAMVAYLSSPAIGAASPGTAWLSELDLDDPSRPLHTFALGIGPVVDMAYDAGMDRLYAVGRFAGLSAPLFVVGLDGCHFGDAGCPNPTVTTLDLSGAMRGADLQGVALSNPVAGQPRKAYVSARLYDADLARTTGARPSFDTGAVLMVLDLSDGPAGVPRARLVNWVKVLQGPGQVKVLPPRPGKGDLVVVSSQSTGDLTVYDDETGTVARVVATDQSTGIPQAGRQPFALAVRDRGTAADVYVAAFDQSTVSVLRVPLDEPTAADLVRVSGSPLRIGKERTK